MSLVSIVGAIVVLAGLVLVAIQSVRPAKDHPASRNMEASAGPLKMSFATTFPGLLVLAMGVLLLVVSAISGR